MNKKEVIKLSKKYLEDEIKTLRKKRKYVWLSLGEHEWEEIKQRVWERIKASIWKK